MMRRLLSLLLLTLPIAAQVRESVTVTVVEVPVTVVDRNGQPVRGLTRDQFQLFVDGKKTDITGFEMLDMATLDEPREQAPDVAQAPIPKAAFRNFLLLFDLSGSSPGSTGRAQAAAVEFVTKQMKRRDLCAVATFDVDKGTQLLTSFTSDRELLQHAIANLVRPDVIIVADALRLAVPARVDAHTNRTVRGLDDRREAVRDAIIDVNARSSRAHQDYLRGRISTELQDLGKLALMIDKQPGQKQVILLSEGFDAELVQGKKLTEGSQTLQERNENETQTAIDRGEIWKVSSEERYGSSHAAFEIREMALLFRRSDVILHAIDVRGLRGEIDIANGLERSSNEGLHLLTRPTGGTVFENAADLRKGFQDVLDKQDVVYVLSFEARRTLDAGEFHEITVKVPAARGGRVTHRAGYYEPSSYPESQFAQTLSLAGILMTDVEKKDVPLTITATPLPSQANVPVMIEIPGDALVKEGAEGVVTADLYVYAFDIQNTVRDFLQQRLGVDLVKNGERLRNGSLRYVSTLELPPGKYMIKALVRVDESGRVGLSRQLVDVAGAKIAATFLNPVSTGVNIAAPGRSEAAVAAFSTPRHRYVPVTHPTLRGATALAVFGSGVDPDAARFAAPMDALKPALNIVEVAEERVLLELDPAGLKAGEYTLLLEGVTLPFRVE